MADKSSFESFAAAAWERHLRLAILLTGDGLRGEELLQDCLVRLYEQWSRLRLENAHAYLRRTLTNRHVSAWRRLRRERLVAEIPDRAAGGPVHRAEVEPIWAALRALPPRQRAVVVLRHYEDLTERDIAAILGCTVGTVKSHNARALERLRVALYQYQYETEEVRNR